MADDEEYDVDVEKRVTQAKRPVRCIRVLEHDTAKAMTADVVEMAQCVLDGLPDGYVYKDVAIQLKRKLDATYGGTWHVIVGKHFGGNVTNDEATLVNFAIDKVYFLVMRSGPPDRPAVAGDDGAAVAPTAAAATTASGATSGVKSQNG